MKPECPMQPEVVWGTSYAHPMHILCCPASNVLILGRDDMLEMAEGTHNFWLTEDGKTTGQGFIMKVDTCPRVIVGYQIKNTGNPARGTRQFRISG